MTGRLVPSRSNATRSTTYAVSEGRLSYVMQRAITAMALIAFPSALAWFAIAQLPESTRFWFNPYSLLTAMACVSIFAALVLVAKIKRHSTMLTWLTMLLMSLGIWSGAEFMLRISATVQTAIIWAPISTIGSTFIPITLYMFTLSYTNSRRRQQPLLFLSMMATSLVFLYVDLTTQLIDKYGSMDPPLKPWGYVFPTGPMYWLFALWFLVPGLASLVQLFYFWRNSIEPATRKQAKLIFIAVSLPFIVGGITDAILPSFHLEVLPPTGSVMTTFMGLIISFGVLRYHYFSFAPDTVAVQIMATMNEAVIGVRQDFRVTYVNPGAERLFALPAEKFMQRRLTDFFTQRLRPADLKNMLHTLLVDKDFGTYDSVDLHTADDRTITVKLSVTRVVDEGQPYGYLLVLTDITAIAQAAAIIERKVDEQTQAVREAKSQLLNSINSLEFGFIIADDRPEVSLVNNVAHDLFCGAHTHAAGDCTSITLAGIASTYVKDAPFLKTIQKCYDKGKPQLIKSAVFRHRTWRIFISPMIDKYEVVGAAIIVQDITEEQILARSRDEFFSIASHELRTPLTAIKGNSSLMLQYFGDALKDPSLHEMVEDIHDSSDRLITIVNDFLEVSRLEQGRVTYQFEELALSRIAEKVIYDLGTTAKQAGISITLGEGLDKHDALPTVIADSGRLKQILYNLVGNAIKFTSSGGITLRAEVVGHHVRVIVTDTGKGIALEMQPLLFHKFQQAGESLLTRDTSKGTGLGLYISRLLARGMSGDLVLEHSEPGKGSTFVVTLPVATDARRKHMVIANEQQAQAAQHNK